MIGGVCIVSICLWDTEKKTMKLDWDKIVSNSVTVLVASVFMGAALQLWNGVQTIDSRIDSNLVDIKATQSILSPKVDMIEKRLAEILKHLDRGTPDDVIIEPFEIGRKGSLELIDDERTNNQMMQQRGF
jgi:hypothetical protein